MALCGNPAAPPFYSIAQIDKDSVPVDEDSFVLQTNNGTFQLLHDIHTTTLADVVEAARLLPSRDLPLGQEYWKEDILLHSSNWWIYCNEPGAPEVTCQRPATTGYRVPACTTIANYQLPYLFWEDRREQTVYTVLHKNARPRWALQFEHNLHELIATESNVHSEQHLDLSELSETEGIVQQNQEGRPWQDWHTDWHTRSTETEQYSNEQTGAIPDQTDEWAWGGSSWD
jgi:hypothetical protein